MPISLLPKDYQYFHEICEQARLAEAESEANPTPVPVAVAAIKPQISAEESKKLGLCKMMYADNCVIPEEKMAQMPKYAYPAIVYTAKSAKSSIRSPTFNLKGLIPELLEIIFQYCDIKFIHQDKGGDVAPALIVALRPEPRLYFHALAVCYQESHLGWCSNEPSASLSRALPFIRKLKLVLW